MPAEVTTPVTPVTPAAPVTPGPGTTTGAQTPHPQTLPTSYDGDGSDGDITITSTTDSEAQVRDALAGKPSPASTTTTTDPPATPAKTPAVAKDPTTPGDATLEDLSEAGKTLSKSRRSFGARIDELTLQREENRRLAETNAAEAARLRVENEALRRAGPTPAPGTVPAPGTTTTPALPAGTPPKPTIADFADGDTYPDPYASLADATAAWHADRAVERMGQHVATNAEAQAQARAAADHQTRMQALNADYHQRNLAFIATVPDYAEVVNAARAKFIEEGIEEPQVGSDMTLHILHSPLGPQMAYHLMQHPEEARRLNALPLRPMLAALGKLEGKLESAAPPAASTPQTPSTPATRAADALASTSAAAALTSTAPAPPTLVGGSPTTSGQSLEEMPFADFVKARNDAERKHGRR